MKFYLKHNPQDLEEEVEAEERVVVAEESTVAEVGGRGNAATKCNGKFNG